MTINKALIIMLAVIALGLFTIAGSVIYLAQQISEKTPAPPTPTTQATTTTTTTTTTRPSTPTTQARTTTTTRPSTPESVPDRLDR